MLFKQFFLTGCLLIILFITSSMMTTSVVTCEKSDFDLLVQQLVLEKQQLGPKWNPRKFLPTRIRKIMKKLSISLPEKCARKNQEISASLIEKIKYISDCFSEKRECPKLNSELVCKNSGEERIRKVKNVDGLSCPYFECVKKEVVLNCPAIFGKDLNCKEGYYQVVRKVKFGKLDCDRKVCVKKIVKCPEIEVKCQSDETRQITKDSNNCPVVKCEKLTCPKEFLDSKNIKCQEGWTLSEEKVKYQRISCSVYKCVKTPCPKELRDTRHIKCSIGQRVVRKTVTVNGRQCGKYECETVQCPIESKPQCADGQIAKIVSIWYHGKRCESYKCMHDNCPSVESIQCDPQSEQVKLQSYKTESGLNCYKQTCEKRKKTCKNICMNYSQRIGKCKKYEMRGEQQKCIQWSWSGSNQCVEEKLVSSCVRFIQGGQTCVKKQTVTGCARQGTRQECTKWGEKEICSSSSSVSGSKCEKYETRVVGCSKYRDVTACAQWNSIPKTKCESVKYCSKELPSKTEKYCKAYHKVCQKGTKQICTTTSCPCSKKPITKCRTVYFDACCKSECKSWETRKVPGKCTSWATRQKCASNGSEKVCAKYKTTKECVEPRTEKVCTKWSSGNSKICTRKEKVRVCLASKYTEYCAETSQKEVCESWAVTNARCAEFKQSKVCVRRSQGQQVCKQYQSFGGQQVCVESAKEDVCAEYKQVCTFE